MFLRLGVLDLGFQDFCVRVRGLGLNKVLGFWCLGHLALFLVKARC